MSSKSDRHGPPRLGRPRWYEVLPELTLATGLLLFLIDEPDAATSAFKSTRAIGLMAAAAVLWIGGRVVLARFLHARVARTALFGLAAVAALAVVVVPAYRNETVVEAFPVSPAPDDADTIVPAPSVPPAAPTTSPPPAPSAPVDGQFTAPSGTTPPTSTEPTTTTTAQTAPMRLRSGEFMGVDHRASGTVSIYRVPDGRHVIGLEAFDIQPGPDYDVYVVPGTDRIRTDGGARLDDLRGNQGTQYYEVPADIDVTTGDWTVLIWCQTFAVPVANATPV